MKLFDRLLGRKSQTEASIVYEFHAPDDETPIIKALAKTMMGHTISGCPNLTDAEYDRIWDEAPRSERGIFIMHAMSVLAGNVVKIEA